MTRLYRIATVISGFAAAAFAIVMFYHG